MRYQQHRALIYIGMAAGVFCMVLSMWLIVDAIALWRIAHCPRPMPGMTYTIPFKGTLP